MSGGFEKGGERRIKWSRWGGIGTRTVKDVPKHPAGLCSIEMSQNVQTLFQPNFDPEEFSKNILNP